MYSTQFDVNAVVIDVGSSSTRVGYAGQDHPQAVYSSVIGVNHGTASENSMDVDTPSKATSSGTGSIYVGNTDINIRRDNVELQSPFNEDGFISNWDHVQRLWSHGLNDCLQEKFEEHPVLLVEPSDNHRSTREKYCEILFEEKQVPALFLAKDAVLNCYANARGTGLVLDCGHGHTKAVPVQDGYALQNCIVKCSLGGNFLDDVMAGAVAKLVSDKGSKVGALTKTHKLRPRYHFSHKTLADGSSKKIYEAYPKTHESYEEFMRRDIARDIRETTCRVSDVTFDVKANLNIPTVPYTLPDGTDIFLSVERFTVPELMFDVSPLNQTNIIPMQTMVHAAIEKAGFELRRDLLSSIILAGGNSTYSGFQDRLMREVSLLAPQTLRAKVIAPGNSERRISAWLGGSILASLGSFHTLWMSKAEYAEHGAGLVERLCP